MTHTTSQLGYSDLMAEIHRLSSEKQTGTIFITTGDGHLARIVLHKGEITFLIFDTKYRGYDAIPLIQTIKSGRLQFASDVFDTSQEVPLPSTEEIFHKFSEKGETESIDTKSDTTPTSYRFNDAIKHVQNALATFIGPFAIIVCDEYLEKVKVINSEAKILAMIDAVASEIGDPIEKDAFKTQVKEKLKLVIEE